MIKAAEVTTGVISTLALVLLFGTLISGFSSSLGVLFDDYAISAISVKKNLTD